MKAAATLASLKREVVGRVESLAPFWREVALKIHAHPELGRQEHQAAVWLGHALEEAGFALRRGLAEMPTSFVASRDTRPDAPVVAFTAEYDALPEAGHACGHNLIATAACLAAQALAAAAPSRVRVMGTPDEEFFGGKAQFLKHGMFEGVDFAMMAHGGPRNLPSRDMVGRDVVGLEFHGKSAHASAEPEQGINALEPLLWTFQAVGHLRNQLRPRENIHGVITHGGQRANLIPDFARGEFSVRSTNLRRLQLLAQKLATSARAMAEAVGARVEVTAPAHPYLPMKRNASFEAAYARNLDFIGEPVETWPPDGPLGSTDFGNVSQAVPGIHAYFRVGPPDIRAHTVRFREAACSEAGLAGMVSAAKAMALTGIDLTECPALREAVRRDFETEGKQ